MHQVDLGPRKTVTLSGGTVRNAGLRDGHFPTPDPSINLVTLLRTAVHAVTPGRRFQVRMHEGSATVVAFFIGDPPTAAEITAIQTAYTDWQPIPFVASV